MLDRFKGTALEPLANRLDSVLARMGWTRLRKEELAVALPSGVDAPTILSDPPYRLFDAVFHWED
jgi:hypothetical protein